MAETMEIFGFRVIKGARERADFTERTVWFERARGAKQGSWVGPHSRVGFAAVWLKPPHHFVRVPIPRTPVQVEHPPRQVTLQNLRYVFKHDIGGARRDVTIREQDER